MLQIQKYPKNCILVYGDVYAARQIFDELDGEWIYYGWKFPRVRANEIKTIVDEFNKVNDKQVGVSMEANGRRTSAICHNCRNGDVACLHD